MQSEIKTLIKVNSSYSMATIFGYATNSVPGIEILGLGNRGRLLKEKLVYLTRERGLKLKPVRYVISIEADIELRNTILKEIELPILLVLWHLAGLIPIECLSDCICVGEIQINGDVVQPFIGDEALRPLLSLQKEIDHFKLISEKANSYLWNISTSELLKNIPRIQVSD